MAQRLVIRNGFAVGADGKVLERAAIVVEGGRIASVSAAPPAAQPGDWEIDAEGRAILPGFVNAHTHLALGSLMRLIGLPMRAPASLRELRGSWRSGAEARLDADAIEAFAAAAAGASLRAGVTCVFDQTRAAPGHEEGALAAVARGVRKCGLRAALSYGANDVGGVERGAAGLRESAAFAEGQRDDATLRGFIGLDGITHSGPATLDAAADLGMRFGFHATVAEDDQDLVTTFASSNTRPVQLLHEVGALSGLTLIAHGSTVDRAEADILAASGAFHAITARAAMWWGSALPPVELLASRGVSVALGTDGLGPDAAGEALAASMLIRYLSRDPTAAPVLVGRDLWPNAARLASRVFGARLGILESGAAADIVVMDWRPTQPLPQLSPGDLAILCAGAPAAWAIVDGEVKLRDGKLLGVDEAELAARAREAATRIGLR